MVTGGLFVGSVFFFLFFLIRFQYFSISIFPSKCDSFNHCSELKPTEEAVEDENNNDNPENDQRGYVKKIKQHRGDTNNLEYLTVFEDNSEQWLKLSHFDGKIEIEKYWNRIKKNKKKNTEPTKSPPVTTKSGRRVRTPKRK